MRHLTTLTLFTAVTSLYAQNQCGSDAIHERRLANDSLYGIQHERQNESIREFIAGRGGPDTIVYTVPVVVHVIHLGEPVGQGNNIPDVRVYEAIQGLNDRFDGTLGVGVNIGIRFCLAARTPDGCPTNGIVRVNGSSVPGYASNGITMNGSCGATASAVQDLSKWPNLEYYNIWVVSSICGTLTTGGTVAAYATGAYDFPYDGTVIMGAYMDGSTKVLAHEVGHGWNLSHTFNGDANGTVCPPNQDCMVQGDAVCDTPPHIWNHCGEPTNPCSALGDWDNSRYNYMSYCWPDEALFRFTPGQRERMRATMQMFPRSALLNSMGCLSPMITITASVDPVCVGSLSVLTASGPYLESFLWSTGDTTVSITVSPIAPTDYSITATTTGGCLLSTSISIATTAGNVPPQPIPVVGNAVGCAGTVRTYSINQIAGASSYSWTFDGQSIGADTTVTLALSMSGTLAVTANNYCGSSAPSLIGLDVLQPSSLSITDFVCGSYLGPDGSVYNSSGVYTTVLTNAVGCDSVITMNLTFAPEALPVSNGDVLACSADGPQTLSVSVPPGVAVEWYNAPVGGALIGTGTDLVVSVPGEYYAQGRSTFSLNVGDPFGGGTVGYLFQSGDPGYILGLTSGIVAAPTDIGLLPWGCQGTLINGTALGLNTGQQNTNVILNGCVDPNAAARLCDSYQVDGVSDWYLPSFSELLKLYENRIAIGGFAPIIYWTSTQPNGQPYSPTQAHARGFGTGFNHVLDKSMLNGVRPVRSFSIDPVCVSTSRTTVSFATSDVAHEVSQTICDGQFYEGYNASGVYTDIYVAANGCDSEVVG